MHTYVLGCQEGQPVGLLTQHLLHCIVLFVCAMFNDAIKDTVDIWGLFSDKGIM